MENETTTTRTCPPGTVPYVIKAGDTFYKLAKEYNTTVAAIISANPLVDPEKLKIGETICIPTQKVHPPCPEGNYYTIKPGDTLYRIAIRYNISLDDLVHANPLLDPTRLEIGQIICIPVATPPVTCPPGTRSYMIKAGDTFYNLAIKYRTTVDAIQKANPNVDPTRLLIGQFICMPEIK